MNGIRRLRLRQWEVHKAIDWTPGRRSPRISGAGVTTVQRWEREEGLPVRRQEHVKKGSVYALKSEINEWRASREKRLFTAGEEVAADNALVDAATLADGEPPAVTAAPRSRRRLWVAALVLGSVVVVIVAAEIATGKMRSMPRATAAGLGVPRPLASEPEIESAPSLSPDGRRVVYALITRPGAGTQGGLFIKGTEGAGSPQRLTESPTTPPWARDDYPAWSPDGSRIAFIRVTREAANDVYVIAADGSGPRKVTAVSGIPVRWAADGRSLVVSDRNSGSEPYSIFLVAVDTGARTRVTSPPLASRGDLFASASPDGRYLAFSRAPTLATADVFLTSLDTHDVRPLTFDQHGIAGVAWTPDSKGIVFSSYRSGGLSLWHVPIGESSGEPTLVSGLEGGASYPTLSGQQGAGPWKLAYNYGSQDVNIWRTDLQGEGTQRAVVSGTRYDSDPAVSPDGTMIAFASNRTGATEIWVANTDGSNAREVTFRQGPLAISPSWSPDGRHLAFASTVGTNRDIFVIDLDGSQPLRLTTEPSEEGNPSWSQDGKWIYFQSNRGGTNQIWKMHANGAHPQLVTRGEGTQAAESPDGKLLYFVRSQDIAGLWSIPAGGGEERFVTDHVREGLWAITNTGIAFVDVRRLGSAQSWPLKLYSFRSADVSQLATLPSDDRIDAHVGFSASRDGRFVLWTRRSRATSDIMIIDAWSAPQTPQK